MNSLPCRWLPVVAFLLNLGTAHAADFKLADIFSDGMVLQRGKPVAVFGTGNAGDAVTVKLGDQSKSGTVGNDGNWEVMLDPVAVGAPYTLTASSGSTNLTVPNVLAGDVFLCSGQSNMQFPLKEGENAAQEIAGAAAKTRLHFYGGRWETCSPQSATGFSAVGFYFASALMKDPAMANVPIGVINKSVGATSAEAWTPAAGLTWQASADTVGSMGGIRSSDMYNKLIAPIIRYGMSGVIWYQGETNGDHPQTYEHVLTSLISGWRQAAGNPTLPFFVVQLPAYGGRSNHIYFTWVRDAEAKAAQETPNTTLIVTFDTSDGGILHPKTKRPIGDRLALAVRRDVYHEKVVAEGPKFKGAEADGATMKVHFDTAGEALMGRSDENIRGFFIAGSDGVYHAADVTVDGDTIDLKSDAVPEPKTVRYGWGGVPDCNLVDADGLPAGPFRTDAQPGPDIEFEKDPISHTLVSDAYTVTVNGVGKVTSLIVGKNQFLANGPGGGAGTSIPGMFGSERTLALVKLIGPAAISCSDTEAEMKITCGANDMTWDFQNKGKAINMTVALAPGVTVSNNGGETDLTSGDATIKITGTLETAGDASKGGQMLKITVPPNGQSTLQFSMAK